MRPNFRKRIKMKKFLLGVFALFFVACSQTSSVISLNPYLSKADQTVSGKSVNINAINDQRENQMVIAVINDNDGKLVDEVLLKNNLSAEFFARYSPPPGTQCSVLVFRRFVVLRPPRLRLLGEAPSGDCLVGEVQPSRHTLIAVWCRCAHYGELNRVAAHVLKYLSSVADASAMMGGNMASGTGVRLLYML